MRPERAIVRHWQLVMLAFTFSLLVGALPEGSRDPAGCPAMPAGCGHPRRRHASRACRLGEKSGPASTAAAAADAHRVERDAASGAGVALPLGAAAALLEALVDPPPHRPNWPRSSPTSLAPAHLRLLLDQPALVPLQDG